MVVEIEATEYLISLHADDDMEVMISRQHKVLIPKQKRVKKKERKKITFFF